MHRHCVATGLGLAALLVCLCSQGQDYADFKFGRASKAAWQVSGGHTDGKAPGHALDAFAVYGSDCAGIIDKTADHHWFVTLQAALDFALESATDATLLISEPDGLLLCEPNRSGSADLTAAARRYPVYVDHRAARPLLTG